VTEATTLQRRLASFRSARATAGPPAAGAGTSRIHARGAELAERLAAAVDGEWLATAAGHVVRVETEAITLPLERERLARLPGQPPAEARLFCLDTETTGLATAAGTLAFLVGLGWWEGDRFRQAQLLCPDHGDEPALLAALEAALPPDAWLVTYNGKSFDWPLIVARYRMVRRSPPAHAGHLDLLPHVRRLFRHRLGDARLQTVEREMLGVRRHDDVAGWEIPERFLAFVRGGPAEQLAPIVTHNAEDVRSLGRLLVHLDTYYADPDRRPFAPAGDLLGLARSFSRNQRHAEALGCLDEAVTGWRPPAMGTSAWPFGAPAPASATVSRERILSERARVLRRLGRTTEAAAAWGALTRRTGSEAVRAWVEIAKLREHRLADLPGALDAALAATTMLERLRFLAAPEPALEGALAVRRRRLEARLASARDAPGRVARLPGARRMMAPHQRSLVPD
jgi:uncharacterized protein